MKVEVGKQLSIRSYEIESYSLHIMIITTDDVVYFINFIFNNEILNNVQIPFVDILI